MAEPVLLMNTRGFMGLTPDAAINLGKYLTAEHVGILFNSQQPPIPDDVRTADQMVGDGNARAQRLLTGWMIPLNLPIGGTLNAETAARMGGRNLGGTRAVSAELAVASGAYDVTWLQRKFSQSAIPILSTIGFDLGGYKFIHPTCAIDNYEIQFEKEGAPTWSGNLRNTGYYRINNGLADNPNIDLTPVIVPPAVPRHHLMTAVATKVTFSNGTTIDFAADGELISGACGNNNQIIVVQQPGDPTVVTGDFSTPAYAREIYYGVQLPMARLKVKLESTLRAFVLKQNRTDITSLTYLFRSDEKILLSAYHYEFEWKAELAEIESVQSDPDGDRAAVTMNFYIKDGPVNGMYWQQRVRTDNNLLA